MSWQSTTIGDVCNIVNGGTPKTGVSEFLGGAYMWITPAEMGGRDTPYVAETERTITAAGLAATNLLPPHSVILSSRAPIGHLVINSVPMATNQGCKGLVPSSKIDHKFLYYYLSSIVPLLNELGTGTTFKELSGGNLKKVPILLPPLKEQKRIIALLDEAFEGLDRARANTEANLQNARELFAVTIEASLMSAGGVPITLGELLERKWITSHLDGNHGSNYPRKEEFISEGVPYISANCIEGDLIDLSKCKYLSNDRADSLRKGVARDRDVIFAHNATVGPVALLRTDEPRVLLSTSLTHYRCDETKICPEFLVYEMRSAGFKKQYEAVMGQATRNQVPITMQRTFTHIIPPVEGQLKIAQVGTKIESCARELDRHYNQKIEEIEALRQSLLHHALSDRLA